MLNVTYTALAQAAQKYTAVDTTVLFSALGMSHALGSTETDPSAVRLSLALRDCGVPLEGRVVVPAGEHTGQRIEINQARLSDWLSQRLGEPEVITYDRAAGGAPSGLTGCRGIVSFMRQGHAPGGYIDLVNPQNLWKVSAPTAGFETREVRFWSLA